MGHSVAIFTQCCLTQAKNGTKIHIKYVAHLGIYTEQRTWHCYNKETVKQTTLMRKKYQQLNTKLCHWYEEWLILLSAMYHSE